MNDERSPEAGPWDDDEDNEQTQVARNPLLDPPPEKASSRSVAGKAETSGVLQRRGVSPAEQTTTGPSKPGGLPPVRGSLYERLLKSGTLDEIMAIDAAELARQPMNVEAHEVHEIEQPGEQSDEVEDVVTAEHTVALGQDGLADQLEPGSGLFAPVAQDRPSTEPLRDSDLQVISGRDSGGFVRALAQDPDVDEPPAVARFKRPPELPAQKPELPSVLLSPQLSTRQDATERISTAGHVPVPVNSVAPTAAPKSEAPHGHRRASGVWFGLGAAALVAMGIGLTRMNMQEPQRRAGASQPEERTMTPLPSEPAVVEAKAKSAAEAEPAAPEATPAPSVQVAPSEPSTIDTEAEDPSAEDRAREARRERRARRAQERAEAAAESQASAGEGEIKQPSAVAPPVAAAESDAPASAEQGGNTQPTRAQVVSAMNAVLPRLRDCVGEKHGLADVTITVRAGGFVSYAMVAGTFAGTPEGSCIAKVVKEAQFAPFSEPFVRITYPFQL